MRTTSSVLALLALVAVVSSADSSARPGTSKLAQDTVVAQSPEWQSQASFTASRQNLAFDDDATTYAASSSIHDERKGKAKEGWVYLIRHGEKFKNPDKTGLSQRGIRRAHCLSKVFGDSKHGIKYILAQDYKPDGRRKRPFETVKPLSKTKGIHLDHHCDRDDIPCAAKYIRRHTRVKTNRLQEDDVHSDVFDARGDNVLVVWEHARLSDIAKALGVKGLHYPSDRYDVVFKVRNGKVHSIYSEECDGLDEEWFNWRGHRRGKHGKGGRGGRLIDDESWAEPPDDDA